MKLGQVVVRTCSAWSNAARSRRSTERLSVSSARSVLGRMMSLAPAMALTTVVGTR